MRNSKKNTSINIISSGLSDKEYQLNIDAGIKSFYDKSLVDKSTQSIGYINPDKNILLKYGFKEVQESIKGAHSFRAEFNNSSCVATLFFTGGCIVVDEEYHFEYNEIEERQRLNRIWIENDSELDTILRQTFPSIGYKPKL